MVHKEGTSFSAGGNQFAAAAGDKQSRRSTHLEVPKRSTNVWSPQPILSLHCCRLKKTEKTLILMIILRRTVANPSLTSVRSSVLFLFSALFGAIDRLYVGLILGLPPALSYIRYVDPSVARVLIHL